MTSALNVNLTALSTSPLGKRTTDELVRSDKAFEMNRSVPVLPGLEALLDTTYLEHLLVHRMKIAERCQVHIDSLKYKPGTNCLVSYRIDASPLPSPLPLHAKTFQPDLWRTVRDKAYAWKRRWGQEACWIDDTKRILVFPFPYDSELPTIARFFQAPDRLLDRLNIPIGDPPRATVLAYKPNRRLTIRVNEDYLLKFHCADRFAQILSVSKALRGLEPITPRYVDRSHRYAAIVQRWIEGEPLNIAPMNDPQFESILQQIVHWNERLRAHSSIDRFRPRLPDNGIGALKAKGQTVLKYVKEVCPELGGLIDEYSQQMDAAADLLSPSFGLNHGDFHLGQLIVSPRGLRGCDFDNASWGDQTADLANGVAHLILDSIVGKLDSTRAEQAEDQIQEALLQQDATVKPSFRFHLACGLARLGSTPFRTLQPDWVNQTEQLLKRGLQTLNSIFPRSENRSVPSPLGRSTLGRSTLDAAILDDPPFESLAPALDCQVAQQTFQERLPELAPWLINRNIVAANTIRHKPGRRCLIHYRLSSTTDAADGPGLLAKVHWRRADQQAFDLQNQLYRNHGFDESASDGVQVPRALGLLPEWKMWLQSFVPGKTAQEWMEQGSLAEVAPRIGYALAKLHSCRFQPERTHTVEEELGILRSRLTWAQKIRPQYADRLATVLWACERLAQRVSLTGAPIHRDFYQDQILFDDSKTFLVDLDLVSWGHPVLDLANFVAHLIEFSVRRHGCADAFAPEAAMIVDTYRQYHPASSTDLAGLKTISLARHLAICLTHDDRQSSFLSLLAEVEHQCRIAMSSQSA